MGAAYSKSELGLVLEQSEDLVEFGPLLGKGSLVCLVFTFLFSEPFRMAHEQISETEQYFSLVLGVKFLPFLALFEAI